jgi:peptide-methionine (R)-S-oxide reductase
MNKIIRNGGVILLALILQQCTYSQTSSQTSDKTKSNSMDTIKNENNPAYSHHDSTPVNLTNDQWKKILPAQVYNVARLKGTERPWTSSYENSKEVGTYYCAVCGNALFRSDTKFESGCGWPSFYEPISKGSVIFLPDHTLGMERTEVECGRCKSHLGHVFNDGPPPTGLRYCINGVVLDFAKAQNAEKKYNEKH